MTINETRVSKIARNINAMDVYYQYIDDGIKFKFWDNLRNKLNSILKELSDADRLAIKDKCDETNAAYFGL